MGCDGEIVNSLWRRKAENGKCCPRPREVILVNWAEIFWIFHTKHCKRRENTSGATHRRCQQEVKIKRILLTDMFFLKTSWNVQTGHSEVLCTFSMLHWFLEPLERERERILLSLTGCSHRCRHQKVWIHSSLKVKPKQNWTPWYTEMPTPASHTNPGTGTAAPCESEPALLMKFNPFSQILEQFGEGNALGWIDSLQGVQAVSVGEGWLTLRGIRSRGRLHTKLCSETLQWPLLPRTHPLPHRIIPN